MLELKAVIVFPSLCKSSSAALWILKKISEFFNFFLVLQIFASCVERQCSVRIEAYFGHKSEIVHSQTKSNFKLTTILDCVVRRSEGRENFSKNSKKKWIFWLFLFHILGVGPLVIWEMIFTPNRIHILHSFSSVKGKKSLRSSPKFVLRCKMTSSLRHTRSMDLVLRPYLSRFPRYLAFFILDHIVSLFESTKNGLNEMETWIQISNSTRKNTMSVPIHYEH